MRIGGQTEVLGNTEEPWGRQGTLGWGIPMLFGVFWGMVEKLK